MVDDTKVKLTVSVPTTLDRRVRAFCEVMGMTLSKFAERAIEAQLEVMGGQKPTYRRFAHGGKK